MAEEPVEQAAEVGGDALVAEEMSLAALGGCPFLVRELLESSVVNSLLRRSKYSCLGKLTNYWRLSKIFLGKLDRQ